ncbi:MAG: hypothetical protein WBM44_05775 [Waterburya sp.]
MITSLTNKHVRNRVIILVGGLLFLGFCLLTILPWVTYGYGFDLDQSWMIALHIAAAAQIQFGTDFIYTYGPYGFLHPDTYHPETVSLAFTLRLLIAVAVWAGLFKLVRDCLARRDGSIFWLIPLLLFFPNPVMWLAYFQFTLVLLPFVLYFYVSKRLSPAFMLTIITAALSSLIKHNYLLLSLVFVFLITIDEVSKLKRIPQVAPLYLVFLWLFWAITAQDIANFPPYLINGLEIVRGFSQTMGIAGNLDEIILYLLSTGLFIILVGLLEWRSRRQWGILPTLGLAAFFFITFKGAFARHDAHGLQAFFNIVPVILIFTALLWSSIVKTKWRIGKKFKLSAIFIVVASWLVVLIMGNTVQHHYLNYGYTTYTINAVKSTFGKINPAVGWLTGKNNSAAAVDLSKEKIREHNYLPPISGTVDLYPNQTASIFAYDLPYQPRPVFQSFSAYTSKLAQLNADHLKQPEAAKSILFDLNPINGHLASFEDGLSWPEILTRYDITNIEGRYLLLERNLQPRQYQLDSITQETEEITLGEWYEIPNKLEPVWAKLDLHPNLWGKLASATLRLPSLYLEVETADGMQAKYRTIPDIISSGFLISPVLSDRWDFLALAATDWEQRLSRQKVTRFRIVDQGINSWLYPRTYQVELSQLQFPRQNLGQVVGWQTWNQLNSTGNIVVKPGNRGLQKVNLDSNQATTVWFAHAPTKIGIELPNDSQSFSFEFGILDEALTGANEEQAFDGVEVKVTALVDGDEKLIFSRKLQPTKNIEDRGVQNTAIDLSQINTTKLILEMAPGENNMWDWSYWSGLKAE